MGKAKKAKKLGELRVYLPMALLDRFRNEAEEQRRRLGDQLTTILEEHYQHSTQGE